MAERVLIADDDKDYLHLMASHLTRHGFTVETAEDGVAALEALKSHGRAAVLVTDLMMPEMNGLELLRRARELDPYLEVVVISGAGTLESAISAMREGGAFDYLPKPLDKIGDLSLAVQRAATYRRLVLEREELHTQVLAERERLRSVIASAGDAILSADGDGLISAANPAACHLLGENDLVGRDAWTRLPAPLAVLLAHWQSFEGERPTVTEVPWPAGCIQMITLTPIPSRQGSGLGGWVMVLRDITHLKRLDQITMNLLSEAAGRIRTPLARAFSTLVELNETSEAQTEGGSEKIDRLMTQLGSIRRWTDDLVALVQIEAGTGPLPAPVDLGGLVHAAEDSAFLNQARLNGMKLQLDVEDGVPWVHADREHLRRLLELLVGQAAWRSRPGGTVHVGIRYRQDQVWLEVTDEAELIAEADLPHLFERVYVESHDLFGPTGLELPMAKAIVDRNGGQIWVRRQGDNGNTFAVSFPPLEMKRLGGER
jgi:PAS domain S-box-containing protein